MRLRVLVFATLLACSPACGDDDNRDDSANGSGGSSGVGGADPAVWTCRLDGFEACMCANQPGAELDACPVMLPCCIHYLLEGFGEICSCSTLEEVLCAEFLMAAEDQQAERVPNCPP
jgi:hypothetical protein